MPSTVTSGDIIAQVFVWRRHLQLASLNSPFFFVLAEKAHFSTDHQGPAVHFSPCVHHGGIRQFLAESTVNSATKIGPFSAKKSGGMAEFDKKFRQQFRPMKMIKKYRFEC